VVLSAFTLIRAKKKGATVIEIGIKNGCSCHQYGKEVLGGQKSTLTVKK